MSETMRERIAKAISPEWFREPCCLENYPGQAENYRSRAFEKAVAVLESMREPTEEMLAVAKYHAEHGEEFGDHARDPFVDAPIEEVWPAMIDAALSEK